MPTFPLIITLSILIYIIYLSSVSVYGLQVTLKENQKQFNRILLPSIYKKLDAIDTCVINKIKVMFVLLSTILYKLSKTILHCKDFILPIFPKLLVVFMLRVCQTSALWLFIKIVGIASYLWSMNIVSRTNLESVR